MKMPLQRFSKLTRAFTLVEMALATGIVSFAMVGILGLIPVGLNTFRSAITLSIEANIAQRLSSDVQRTDFANQLTSSRYFYYDEQGLEVPAAAAIYTAELQPPANIASAGVVSADVPARTVLIRITNRTQPGEVSSYAIVIPTDA